MPARTIELKNLNIQPLSVAKYFYDKGIELNSTMQDLLYLSYWEVLKKENTLLFEEEFQAWEGGPTLNSVFYAMHDYFEKNKNKFLSEQLEEVLRRNEQEQEAKIEINPNSQ